MTTGIFALPPVLERTLAAMEPIWQLASDHGLTPVQLALSFILSFPEVSTVIPGIKTAAQADSNTAGLVQLPPAVMTRLQELFAGPFQQVMADFQQAG
ncbi:MAG: aldo/keto reductase [Lewinellaceae bacterium]|nr:aldo/keto reductase [Lewinellaceae bacterium]